MLEAKYEDALKKIFKLEQENQMQADTIKKMQNIIKKLERSNEVQIEAIRKNNVNNYTESIVFRKCRGS